MVDTHTIEVVVGKEWEEAITTMIQSGTAVLRKVRTISYILCSTTTSIHIIIKLILLLLHYESVYIFYVVGERKYIYLPRVSTTTATPSIALYEQRVPASQRGPCTQSHCSRLSQSVPAIGAV